MDVRVYATTMAGYNRWVNEQIFAAAASCADEDRRRAVGGAFGSLHATLEHLLVADQLWLQRFARVPLTAHEGRERLADFEVLRRERVSTDTAIDAWAAALTEDFAAAPFQFTSLAYQRDFTMPGWGAVTHLFNHQTHHRGQVTTLLRLLGCEAALSADLPVILAE
ncbi:MAG TPA: DinB family protein [Luteitalea sp.]|nr:DinB family protein [Luteitalea sp.]